MKSQYISLMKPSRRPFLPLLKLFCFFHLGAQDLEPFKLSERWLDSIRVLAPVTPSVPVKEKKEILIFSLHTGYDHWVIPHTEAVMNLLATHSGIATCTTSKDISIFEKENLAQFDIVIMNNTCPKRDRRNLFYDVLKSDQEKTEEQLLEEAAVLENNLINFVKEGGGLMLLHGGATVQNDSPEFSKMTGGSFDFHPEQQPISVKLADPGHPLTSAFKGKGFVHTDEPYFYKNAYDSYNFHPLLYMEADELEGLEEREFKVNKRYLAWIKRYGTGRVFVAAPSHNAQSFKNRELLQFFQDAIQYVLGQLECDDSPIGNVQD
jgi:type 1 glutamine amidotransferase